MFLGIIILNALNFSNMRICFVVVAIHDVSSVVFYFHYAYKKYGYCFPSKETKFPLKFKKVLYVCIIKSVSNDFKKGSLGAKRKNEKRFVIIHLKFKKSRYEKNRINGCNGSSMYWKCNFLFM
jgi:hypothetical protein